MAEMMKQGVRAAEFFELPESVLPVELIQGEVVMSPAPAPEHQRISRRTCRLIEDLAANGEVFSAPIDVYFDDRNIPQPDIVWVAEGSRCVVGEKYLQGPPDLIVEVFSPGTTRRDRKSKFQVYQRYVVQEYWMIDPAEQYVEVYYHEDEKFVYQGLFEPGETFTSRVLSKAVPVGVIFGKA